MNCVKARLHTRGGWCVIDGGVRVLGGTCTNPNPEPQMPTLSHEWQSFGFHSCHLCFAMLTAGI
jgi:hypothetical protein